MTVLTEDPDSGDVFDGGVRQALVECAAGDLAAVVLHGGRQDERAGRRRAVARCLGRGGARGQPLAPFPPRELGGGTGARRHATQLARTTGLERVRGAHDGHAGRAHCEQARGSGWFGGKFNRANGRLHAVDEDGGTTKRGTRVHKA